MKKTHAAPRVAPIRITHLRAEPTVTLAVSPISSVCGRAMSFTATVAAVAADSGVPTGTVSFSVNGGDLVPAQLQDGVAIFTTPLPAGSHTITAGYNGDDDFRPTPATTLTTRIWRHGFADAAELDDP